eukprot:8390024-Pyramimonas_sp.AAC.1
MLHAPLGVFKICWDERAPDDPVQVLKHLLTGETTVLPPDEAPFVFLCLVLFFWVAGGRGGVAARLVVAVVVVFVVSVVAPAVGAAVAVVVVVVVVVAVASD